MFKKLSQSYKFPHWAGAGTRWQRLVLYDNLLDGIFYDHLPFSFYDETDSQGAPIELARRRPSVQYRLPRYVARWAARKLFAGRHAPKVRVSSGDAGLVKKLVAQSHLWPRMYEAAYRGSVGSVGVTFRVDGERCGIKIWHAVDCSPSFDDFGELTQLRVHYVTNGLSLALLGLPVEKPNESYWFVRDFLPDREVTYAPPRLQDWNPVSGGELAIALETTHNLGFVPGVWIANPGCIDGPDGPALWEDAIPNTIEMDYLLSQAARGARYNCAPQLVTIGPVRNTPEGGFVRGPQTYLAFDPAHKNQQGETLGGGDAKLLEMTGSGTKAALDTAERLKKDALEQIGVIHKDPSEMPGPLSGRAMEFVDEDAHDVAMLWRTTYGDGAALQLLRKMIAATELGVDPTKVTLQWPRIYQPTPDDLVKLVTGLAMAVKPIEVGQPNEQGEVQTLPALMDIDTAKAYLEANLDLGVIDEPDVDSAPGAGNDAPPRQPQDESNPSYGERGNGGAPTE